MGHKELYDVDHDREMVTFTEKYDYEIVKDDWGTEPLKIAIMGCVVNGPGEAREVDIGIAGGDGNGVLFRKGKVIKKFEQHKLVDVLLHEVREYVKDLDIKNQDT